CSSDLAGLDGQTPRRGGRRLPSAAVHPPSDPAPDWKPVGSPASPLAARQSAFAAALGRQLPRGDTAGRRGDPDERARDAAEQLVTQTFLLPLLKQLRENDHSAPPFAPTQAEKQFRALGDAGLAQ